MAAPAEPPRTAATVAASTDGEVLALDLASGLSSSFSKLIPDALLSGALPLSKETLLTAELPGDGATPRTSPAAGRTLATGGCLA